MTAVPPKVFIAFSSPDALDPRIRFWTTNPDHAERLFASLDPDVARAAYVPAERYEALVDMAERFHAAAEIALSVIPENQRVGEIWEFLVSIRDHAAGALQ